MGWFDVMKQSRRRDLCHSIIDKECLFLSFLIIQTSTLSIRNRDQTRLYLTQQTFGQLFPDSITFQIKFSRDHRHSNIPLCS